MNDMVNVNFRMEKEVKQQADILFNALGLNMSTALNAFVKQAILNGGIPFELSVTPKPNSETIEAMLEAVRIARDPQVKGYKDMDELFRDLKA